jgi:hypothetical protein
MFWWRPTLSTSATYAANVRYSPCAKFATRWIPKTSEAPTPVRARMAPVMRPFRISWRR